jgi:hypothetical protein
MWFIMWQLITLTEVTAVAPTAVGRTEGVVQAVTGIVETVIRGLMQYDNAPSGESGIATQTKVREFEQLIITAAGAVGPMHGMKARDVLQVPSAFLHTGAGAARATTKAGWAGLRKKEEEAAAATAAAAPATEAKAQMEEFKQQMLATMTAMQRQVYQQPAYNPVAATTQQQLAQQIPFQQQQQPRGYGGFGRPQGPCFFCKGLDHIMRDCPEAAKARQGVTAAAAGPMVRQYTQHAQSQYELTPQWQQQYSPEWHAPQWHERAPQWQPARMLEAQRADEMSGGMGVGWLSRQRTEQLSSARVFNNIFNQGQSAAAATSRIPTQPQCECGECGACTQSIDLLLKEKRESKQVAKQPFARKLETVGEKVLEKPSRIIQIAGELKVWADEKLRELGSWRLRGSMGEEDGRDRGCVLTGGHR